MTPEQINELGYVDLMAFIGEVNRPPGGKDYIRLLIQNTFINKDSAVLDIGCNTGYCSFEIANLAKSTVTGVDVNENMVEEAQKLAETLDLSNPPTFRLGDGMKLDFPDNKFDLVMSGGSTAFISDKKKALKEYARVTKQWGFVADINFYYQESPPQNLLKKLNSLLGITIIPWDIEYWKSLYKGAGLEEYYIHVSAAKTCTKSEIEEYCHTMSDKEDLTADAKSALTKRLIEIMSLFNENNSLLNNGLFVYRKRPSPEQISLFGS